MKKTFNVIICGSKYFSNYELLKERCDYFLSERIKRGEEIVIISGGSGSGVDKLGEDYAKEKGYEVKVIKALWDKYGKKAGYLKNQKMVELGNACIVFQLASETKMEAGLKMLVDISRKEHLLVREIKDVSKEESIDESTK